jgi:hypothetical protein
MDCGSCDIGSRDGECAVKNGGAFTSMSTELKFWICILKGVIGNCNGAIGMSLMQVQVCLTVIILPSHVTGIYDNIQETTTPILIEGTK